MDNILRYEVKVIPNNDKTIYMETASTMNGIRDVISREIMDTKDKRIKDALIALGWTPPPELANHN